MTRGWKQERSRTALAGEFGTIRLLERALASSGGKGRRRVHVGIGDDAAVIQAGKGTLVWTVDTCVEGVHFIRAWMGPEDVGWRSFTAAVSDLAAMGARPVAALANLVVPADVIDRDLKAVARGQAQASDAVECPLVGGNVSRGCEFSVTTTVLGEANSVALRSGARAGDALWLCGEVGQAAAGYRLLAAGVGSGRRRASAPERRCIQAWRRPSALIDAGVRLARVATSLIDISDGLSGDAHHLADAGHVRIVVEQSRLEHALSKDLHRAAQALDQSPLDLALTGGEDYALLATGPARRRPREAVCIGRVEAGRGVQLERPDGSRVRLGRGFDHLAE